jgi:antirestriction protein ArdC
MKPWQAEHTAGHITRPLRNNGTPYRGMNLLLLLGEAMAKGCAAPIWMTYKQAQEPKGQVCKDEHGSLVVFANRVTKTETNEKGEDTKREIPFLKGYTVFNVKKVEGLPAQYNAQPENPLPLSERIANAHRFMANTTATIHHGGNSAFYAPSRESIQLPPFEVFKDKESYYATALHKLTYWTKHERRLDRDFGPQEFGDAGYAREELVQGRPRRLFGALVRRAEGRQARYLLGSRPRAAHSRCSQQPAAAAAGGEYRGLIPRVSDLAAHVVAWT